MLFILTGDIQIGKTRWLQALIESLTEAGVPCHGVVAPGQWVDHGEQAGDARYEKLGIDNVLLPEGVHLEFARRRDLAEGEGSFNAASQAGRAQLGWAISDDAISQVNAHFCSLCAKSNNCMLSPEDEAKLAAVLGDEYVPQERPVPGLLVVDELGRLELLRGEGLTSAMDVLMKGPTGLCSHALIVVRESLLQYALNKFDGIWGEILPISPNDDARAQVFSAFNR